MIWPVGQAAIELRNVRKVYPGRVQALRGIDLSVGAGEIFGLLGPNGAGKSTLVKIMMTVVRPTAAAGTILGRPIGHKPTLARIGYLPENHRFPAYLTGRQVIEFFGTLSRMPRTTRKRRTEELLEIVGMRADADRRISTFSKGMAQRIGIAQALAADPQLVVLDEPTDGLDPVGRRDVRALLTRLRAEGRTVFINSHLLSELEMVCDRVAILVGGQVLRQGTMDQLAAGKGFYRIELDGQSPLAGLPEAVAGCQPASTFLDHHTLRIDTTEAAAIQPLLDSLRARRLVIRSVELVRPSLEDLFIDIVQAQYRPAPPVPPIAVPAEARR